jgi:carbon storage regulator
MSRKQGEAVVVDQAIKVQVLSIQSDKVRLGFEAPPSVLFYRQEMLPPAQPADARTQPPLPTYEQLAATVQALQTKVAEREAANLALQQENAELKAGKQAAERQNAELTACNEDLQTRLGQALDSLAVERGFSAELIVKLEGNDIDVLTGRKKEY